MTRMARRFWVAVVTCLVLAMVLYVIGAWRTHAYYKRVGAADTAWLCGLCGLKQWHESGEFPESVDELIDQGLIVPYQGGRVFDIPGLAYSVQGAFLKDVRLRWPTDTSGWHVADEVVVDSSGREVGPFVELEGEERGELMTRAQRRVANTLYRLVQGIPLDDSMMNQWLTGDE